MPLSNKIQRPLLDTFKRHHKYLRLSLTDRCNFNCSYCMPPDYNIKFSPQSKLLTVDEIYRLSKIFVQNFGFDKIRLTGGEPTLRSDLNLILKNFASPEFTGVKFGISTNGLLMHRHFDSLLGSSFRNIKFFH